MTSRILPLSADRLRVLRALVAGGRVELRRCYPFPAKHHLIRLGDAKPAPAIADHVIADLVARGLIQPTRHPDLAKAGDTDTLDFVATPAAHRVVKDRGIAIEDPQTDLITEPVREPRTGMDSAA